MNKSENNFDKIKIQIDLLKKRLVNIDKTLNIQEEVLNTLNENTNSLLGDTQFPNKNTNSVQEVMKSAFPKRKIPRILFS